MSEPEAPRRQFLGFLTFLVLGAIGLLLALVIVPFFLGPLRRESRGNAAAIDVGAIADFPAGEWRLCALESTQDDGWKKTRVRHAVWVRRHEAGTPEFTVLSSICPHLGCPVNWQPEQARFFCPCHGGQFDQAGTHTSGPPPRSLDPLDYTVRGGRLLVRWQNFKIGTAERIPLDV